MTEQEEKMWQEDLDMISKLNKEVDELHNRIDKAIEYIKENTQLAPYNEDGEGGGLELCDYDIQNLLEILKGKE